MDRNIPLYAFAIRGVYTNKAQATQLSGCNAGKWTFPLRQTSTNRRVSCRYGNEHMKIDAFNFRPAYLWENSIVRVDRIWVSLVTVTMSHSMARVWWLNAKFGSKNNIVQNGTSFVVKLFVIFIVLSFDRRKLWMDRTANNMNGFELCMHIAIKIHFISQLTRSTCS